MYDNIKTSKSCNIETLENIKKQISREYNNSKEILVNKLKSYENCAKFEQDLKNKLNEKSNDTFNIDIFDRKAWNKSHPLVDNKRKLNLSSSSLRKRG